MTYFVIGTLREISGC